MASLLIFFKTKSPATLVRCGASDSTFSFVSACPHHGNSNKDEDADEGAGRGGGEERGPLDHGGD
jgi:hypothetical protein